MTTQKFHYTNSLKNNYLKEELQYRILLKENEI